MSVSGHASSEEYMIKKKPIQIGDQFGKLTVEQATDLRKSGHIVWLCRCDCGGRVKLDTATLRRGVWQSCGCDKNVKPGMRDLTGSRFGRLTALKPTAYVSRSRGAQWLCRCDCGAQVLTFLGDLTDGKKKSCGCLNSEASRSRLLLAEGTSVKRIEDALTKKFAHNSSGYTGVYYHKQMEKWGARIQFKGKHYSLGLYGNIEDAIKARKEAEAKYFEAFPEQYYGRTEDDTPDDLTEKNSCSQPRTIPTEAGKLL